MSILLVLEDLYCMGRNHPSDQSDYIVIISFTRNSDGLWPSSFSLLRRAGEALWALLGTSDTPQNIATNLDFFVKNFLTILFGFFDKGFLIFKCGSIHNLSISAIMVPVRQKLDKR